MSKSNDNATLREGYARKGGINPSPSQIKERPAPPASMHPATTESEKGASPSFRRFYYSSFEKATLMSLQYGMRFTVDQWSCGEDSKGDFVGRPDKYIVHPECDYMINNMSPEEKCHLRAVGLWPETEGV